MEIRPIKLKKHADGIRQRGLVIDLSSAVRAKKVIEEQEEAATIEPEVLPQDVEEEAIVVAVDEQETTPIILTEENSSQSKVVSKKLSKLLSVPKIYLPHKAYMWGGLSALLVLFFVLTFSFSNFTVSFKPKEDSLSLSPIVAALDVSVAQVMSDQRVVPAELLKFSKKVSKEFAATGRKVIEDKAKGVVRIYNSYSSSPQKLISSTRFISDSGKLYRLPETLTIPGASIEEGRIIPRYVNSVLISDQAGEEYNLEKETSLKLPGFKGGPKYETFYAVAPNGFSGGFRGEAGVVSKDDLKKSQEETSKIAYDEIKSEFAKKIPPGFQTLEGLREIQVLKITAPKENSKADKFSIEIEARGRIMVFKKEDGERLIKEILLKKDSAVEYIEGSSSAKYQVQNTDFEKGKSMVSVEGSIRIASKVDERDLMSMIKGQKERAVQEFLKSRTELASFNLSLFPPWRTSVPKNENKIKFIKERP